MQSPPFPRYLVPPRSKYSPQHHILKHPQLPFLPHCQRQSFAPIQNNRQNYSSIYLDLKLPLISSGIEFWFVKVVPKYLNSSTLSKQLYTVVGKTGISTRRFFENIYVILSGFIIHFCTIICILIIFLSCDTLITVTEVTETCEIE